MTGKERKRLGRYVRKCANIPYWFICGRLSDVDIDHLIVKHDYIPDNCNYLGLVKVKDKTTAGFLRILLKPTTIVRKMR